MQNQHEGCCKNRDHMHDGCCKDREHQHEGCHSAHQHENASCGGEHRHDTAVVVMDRAVVDVSDYSQGNFGWSFLIS